MKHPWTLRPPADPSPALRDAVGGHPIVAQLLAQRGLSTPEAARPFLDPSAYTPTPPTALYGVDEAARLLLEAIEQEQNILVWGDFDVDGQTSTSLLVAALQQLAGVDRVRFHIPNRFSEGHGIQPDKFTEVLGNLRADGFDPHLLLTCDTGIAEAPGVTLAKAEGMTVVITDHHDLTPEFEGWDAANGGWQEQQKTENSKQKTRNGKRETTVLRADAIVNPKLQPLGDPLRTLPGVGVAYKLIQHLFALAGCSEKAVDFLDLVALGIVADVAEQVHDARYLLQRGLDQLRATRRTGLLALMDVARLTPATVDAESIGFQLGPRMNALGRLEDATVSVELLTTRDPVRAGQLAAKMERLNQQRRLLTSQISAAALNQIERDPSLLDYNGLVLTSPTWHAGIVGIVASRLVEEFGKPTLLLLNPPGDPARGSARSIPSVDIGASIAACSHLLIGHGGHPGAAGVTLLPENIDRFRRELSRQIDEHRIADAPEGLLIDAELDLSDIDLALIEQIQRLAPFGNGNPTPHFLSRGVDVANDRRIGREGTHRRLEVRSLSKDSAANGKGPTCSVIWFNGADVEIPQGPVDLVYTLGINEYRGERSPQLSFVALRAAEQKVGRDSLLQQSATDAPTRTLHDLRREPVEVAKLPVPEVANWYVEGTQSNGVNHSSRTTHHASRPLVLWSAPPSTDLLHSLLDSAAPTELFLIGQRTSDDSLPGVLRNVAGMCKTALKQDGHLPLDRLAARLGTTEAVVRHALLWLEAKGLIALIEWLPDDIARITAGDGVDQSADREILQAELLEQLAEVRAYRRFFQRASLKALGLA